MRPIAWREMVAFAGSVVRIWGREDSKFFFLSLSLLLFLYIRISAFFFPLPKKKCANTRFEMAACRSALRHVLGAFPFGHVAMCPFPLQTKPKY